MDQSESNENFDNDYKFSNIRADVTSQSIRAPDAAKFNMNLSLTEDFRDRSYSVRNDFNFGG